MRKCVVFLLMWVAANAHATVRCAGTTMQTINVDSGQSIRLSVVPVTGVLDYEVARATEWTTDKNESWTLRGSIVADKVRTTAGTAPTVRQRLYNTGIIATSVYVVVTATNAYDSNFKPCAQDFLLNVNPDPLLSRDALRAVVPVAGSLNGANNSVYQTRLVLLNVWDGTISGRVTFHPSGVAAGPNDPTIPYSIPHNGSVTWDDVVAAMSVRGIGSLDIVPDRNSYGSYPMPKVRAQVVSLAQGAGSFAMDLPAVGISSPQYGAVWTDPAPPFLVIDDQHATKRLAIGVRSLADSVELTMSVVAPDGGTRTKITKTYPADYHEQQPLSSWFSDVQTGDRIVISSVRRSANSISGGAIVYLAETDNVTNDVTVYIPQQNDGQLVQPVVDCSFGLCTLIP